MKNQKLFERKGKHLDLNISAGKIGGQLRWQQISVGTCDIDVAIEYARFGGMPMLADVGLEIDRVTAALDGVYSAAVVNEPYIYNIILAQSTQILPSLNIETLNLVEDIRF